jgi:hypothetical protein
MWSRLVPCQRLNPSLLIPFHKPVQPAKLLLNLELQNQAQDLHECYESAAIWNSSVLFKTLSTEWY